jgi:hypothetical protein
MADHAQAKTAVLPGIFETVLRRSSHGDATENERAGAVGLLGGVLGLLLPNVGDGVQFLDAAFGEPDRF